MIEGSAGEGSESDVPQLREETSFRPFSMLGFHRHIKSYETESKQEAAIRSQQRAGTGPSLARQLRPVYLLVAIFVAAWFGLNLVRWGSNTTPSSRLFVSTNQFNEWSGIVAGILGVSIAVASMTWPRFLQVARAVGRVPVISAMSVYILISAAVISGLFLVAKVSASFELSHFYLRISILTAVMLAAGIGSFCGLELIWYSQSAHIDGSVNSPRETVQDILSARKDLQRFFIGATVLITGGIIIIGGLRSSLSADESQNSPSGIASISVGVLLLNGAFFAMLLAFVFIPAYTTWQARIASFRDRLYPVPENGDFSKDWYESRSNLEGLLEMRLGLPGRFLAAAGILAPLIGSIISTVIPTLR